VSDPLVAEPTVRVPSEAPPHLVATPVKWRAQSPRFVLDIVLTLNVQTDEEYLRGKNPSLSSDPDRSIAQENDFPGRVRCVSLQLLPDGHSDDIPREQIGATGDR